MGRRARAPWGLEGGAAGQPGRDTLDGVPLASKSSTDAPVGAVFIAIAGPAGTTVKTHRMAGDRAEIQLRTTALALDLLRRAVVHPAPGR